ncbi:hypothetical protein [Mesorhizobium sp. M0159]|uniref:hypothetical protein n=1 Tax=Mesorhizobium sp. M0159 TaxID=2956900 RepID=UPI00333CB264
MIAILLAGGDHLRAKADHIGVSTAACCLPTATFWLWPGWGKRLCVAERLALRRRSTLPGLGRPQLGATTDFLRTGIVGPNLESLYSKCNIHSQVFSKNLQLKVFTNFPNW